MRYKDSMYTILVRMLNDREEAADALQEAFIKVFTSLPSYRKQSSVGAWIKTIVFREGLSRQRQPQPLQGIDEETHQYPVVWDSNLTAEYLEKAIAQLPEGYRNIFLLVEVEGYSHQEAASLMGISIGTSKSQLYHSKRKLQKILAELMYK